MLREICQLFMSNCTFYAVRTFSGRFPDTSSCFTLSGRVHGRPDGFVDMKVNKN